MMNHSVKRRPQKCQAHHHPASQPGLCEAPQGASSSLPGLAGCCLDQTVFWKIAETPSAGLQFLLPMTQAGLAQDG